jgi:hypothetical protein
MLASLSIVLISVGFNNLNRWGLGLATANAPFNLLGLSQYRGAVARPEDWAPRLGRARAFEHHPCRLAAELRSR